MLIYIKIIKHLKYMFKEISEELQHKSSLVIWLFFFKLQWHVFMSLVLMTPVVCFDRLCQSLQFEIPERAKLQKIGEKRKCPNPYHFPQRLKQIKPLPL